MLNVLDISRPCAIALLWCVLVATSCAKGSVHDSLDSERTSYAKTNECDGREIRVVGSNFYNFVHSVVVLCSVAFGGGVSFKQQR